MNATLCISENTLDDKTSTNENDKLCKQLKKINKLQQAVKEWLATN